VNHKKSGPEKVRQKLLWLISKANVSTLEVRI